MTSKNQTISVISPSLNSELFIRETIDSILQLDYQYVDYLIVDAGSTDDTLDILRSFGNNIRWISEPDKGQSEAINKGWRMTSGEIISWLNADDLLYPGAVQKVREFFNQNPDVDIVYGECDYIDESGDVIQPYNTQDFDYLSLVRDTINYIPQPSTFMRRKVLEEIGYLDDSLSFVMDFDYWLRAGIYCNFAHLPEKLAALRIHSGVKSVQKIRNFADELVHIYEKLFQNPDLPDQIYGIKREAIRNIYFRAADCAFWGDDMGAARQFALSAWSHAPLRPSKMLIPIALGQLGKRILHQKYGNPYLLGTDKPA